MLPARSRKCLLLGVIRKDGEVVVGKEAMDEVQVMDEGIRVLVDGKAARRVLDGDTEAQGIEGVEGAGKEAVDVESHSHFSLER